MVIRMSLSTDSSNSLLFFILFKIHHLCLVFCGPAHSYVNYPSYFSSSGHFGRHSPADHCRNSNRFFCPEQPSLPLRPPSRPVFLGHKIPDRHLLAHEALYTQNLQSLSGEKSCCQRSTIPRALRTGPVRHLLCHYFNGFSGFSC